TALRSASDSFAITASGVPARACNPYQPRCSPPRPASAVVGTSGAIAERVALVIASTLSFGSVRALEPCLLSQQLRPERGICRSHAEYSLVTAPSLSAEQQ